MVQSVFSFFFDREELLKGGCAADGPHGGRVYLPFTSSIPGVWKINAARSSSMPGGARCGFLAKDALIFFFSATVAPRHATARAYTVIDAKKKKKRGTDVGRGRSATDAAETRKKTAGVWQQMCLSPRFVSKEGKHKQGSVERRQLINASV